MKNNNRQNDEGHDTANEKQKGQGSFKKRWEGGKSVYNFKGECPDMDGCVFQVNGEKRKKGQFRETMEKLRVYSAIHHKKHSKMLTVLFNDLAEPRPERPVTPTKTAITGDDRKTEMKVADFDKEVYKAEIKCYASEKRELDQTLASLYELVWGQCSKLMHQRVEQTKDYDVMMREANVTNLLKEIRAISHELEVHVSVYDALHEAWGNYFRYFQQMDDDNSKHLRAYKDLVKVIEHYGGEFF